MQYKRRVSLLILFDTETKKILLQKRDSDASSLPGYWSFFGGGIEDIESPVEAVKREAMEELSLDNMDLKFIGEFDINQENGIYQKYVFIAPLMYPIEVLRRQQNEGEDLNLFDLSDISQIYFPVFNLPIIEHLKHYFSLR